MPLYLEGKNSIFSDEVFSLGMPSVCPHLTTVYDLTKKRDFLSFFFCLLVIVLYKSDAFKSHSWAKYGSSTFVLSSYCWVAMGANCGFLLIFWLVKPKFSLHLVFSSRIRFTMQAEVWWHFGGFSGPIF